MSDKKGIEGLINTSMDNLRKMISANTVVGDAIQLGDGVAVIPISKVSLGFVAGGGEYATGKAEMVADKDLPFGGGSGGGLTVNPIGFLVVSDEIVRFIPVEADMGMDKLMDLAPAVVSKISGLFHKKDDKTK